MLDISESKRKSQPLISMSAAACLILSLFDKPLRPLSLVASASSCFLLFWSFVSRGTAEIRRRGFVIQGGLLPWSRIESYAWEDANSEPAVLKLLARPSLTQQAIKVPARHRAAAESILCRQLAEWPGPSSR